MKKKGQLWKPRERLLKLALPKAFDVSRKIDSTSRVGLQSSASNF